MTLPAMPKPRHHACKDMRDAREYRDKLVAMISYLTPIGGRPFLGRGPTIEEVWGNCLLYFRDYYALGGPPWMRSHWGGMTSRFWKLEQQARKQGYDKFTLD